MATRFSAFLSSTAIAVLYAGAAAYAADYPIVFEERYDPPPMVMTKPAVSAVNAKVEGSYSWIDPDGAPGHINNWNAAGAVSIPLGHSFGLQIDGGFGRFSSSWLPVSINAAGVAAHGFWRDPDFALLGVYGEFTRFSGGGGSLNNWRLAAEGELYLQQFTLSGLAGAERVSAGGLGSDTFFTGEALAAFYATDNIRVHGGVGHRFDTTYGRVGAEAILPFADNNVAVFGDGYIASEFKSVRVGLRVYFGESGKSLIARHREDDPPIRLFDGMNSMGGVFMDGMMNGPNGKELCDIEFERCPIIEVGDGGVN